MKRILVSPNAFKASISALSAAEAICKGLQDSPLQCEVVMLPIADGGNGTLHAVKEKLQIQMYEEDVNGPMGAPHTACYGISADGELAVVELAEASGIHLVGEDELDIWEAGTLGTGQLMADAIDRGVKRILLTVGGSASNDCGLGILDALGVRFLHEYGTIHQPGAADLAKIKKIDTSESILGDVSLEILCDVRNPLLGEEGCARVFGPQKGASREDIFHLEVGMEAFAKTVTRQYGRDIAEVDHGGAAGGVAAGLYGVLNAKLLDGAATVLSMIGFGEALAQADIVITGEGRIDAQSIQGKGTGLVAQLSKKAGKTVIGLCGQVSKTDAHLSGFDAVFPIANGPSTLFQAYSDTSENLYRTAFQVGALLALTER